MTDLIFQVAVGETPYFYEKCQDSVKLYAQNIDADYEILTQPKLRITPEVNHRSENALRLGYLPIFEKENAFEYLDTYDRVCIIDSDVYIRSNAPNIFDQLGEFDFLGIPEKSMPLTDAYKKKTINYAKSMFGNENMPYYNMGVMLFGNNFQEYLNGDTPREFLRRKEFERFINGEGHYRWSTDQVLLNHWIFYSGMNNGGLDWRYNYLFGACAPDAIQESYFIHFFLSKNLPQRGKEIPGIIDCIEQGKDFTIDYVHK